MNWHPERCARSAGIITDSHALSDPLRCRMQLSSSTPGSRRWPAFLTLQGAAERVRRCPCADDDEEILTFHRHYTDNGDHASPLLESFLGCNMPIDRLSIAWPVKRRGFNEFTTSCGMCEKCGLALLDLGLISPIPPGSRNMTVIHNRPGFPQYASLHYHSKSQELPSRTARTH